MTLEEMTQITLNHWMTNYPDRVKKLKAGWLEKQAQACARLTRKEMDMQILVGLDEETAWTEARAYFCLKPPPSYR
jgi:hypothetical protein